MQTISFGKKVIAAVFVAFVVVFAMQQYGIGPAFKHQASAQPTAFTVPTEAPGGIAPTPLKAPATLTLAGTTPAARTNKVVRIETIPWNAIMGLAYAIGGRTTMKGSIMDKAGITVDIKMVNDSVPTSQENQAKFASAYAGGDENPDGPAFVIIMGDGAAQYLSGINKSLAKLGADYYAENVGHVGYSHGEDGVWGPQAWLDDPEAMKGGTLVGVLLDGDWNIAQSLLAAKGIKNNPDVKTWDDEAVNWIPADDFAKAVEIWAAGKCAERPAIHRGVLTGKTHTTCPDGHVTWTPGDVSSARLKGGLVRLLSTKENAYQMPATLIGIHKWDVQHAKTVEALLKASYDGGAEVRASDDALQRAAKASYEIYDREETPGYWAKYYRGVVEPDKTGKRVPLGGSLAITLPEALAFYGLLDGTGGLDGSYWRADYEGFGTIAKQQYPRLVPDFPRYDKAFNATFLQALAEAAPTAVDVKKADLPTFTEGPIEKADQVASRDRTDILFDTGKDTIRPESYTVLDGIYTQLLQSGALAVEFDGHTDNTGNPTANIDLSNRRAKAVALYMVKKAPALFPTNRVTVTGFGDSKPVASNATADGRAQNRRVTVILGTK